MRQAFTEKALGGRNMRAKWVIAAATLTLLSLGATASHADQKADDIKTLLTLTGRDTAQIERNVDFRTNTSLQGFVDAHPDLTSAQIEQLRSAVMANTQTFVAGYEEALIDYYSAKLTDEQVLQAVKFFQSPEGQAYRGASRELSRFSIDYLRANFPTLLNALKSSFAGVLKGQAPQPPHPGPKAGYNL
jgi:hypothetical protein